MVDDKTLFLQFQCDSTISISLLMMVIDTDDLIHDINTRSSVFVLVGLITCIVISRAFQPGNIQKDLDWISWLQFLHNLTFSSVVGPSFPELQPSIFLSIRSLHEVLGSLRLFV